jgi:hypothetical protein
MKNAFYSFNLDAFKKSQNYNKIRELISNYQLYFFANNFFVFQQSKIKQMIFEKAFLLPGCFEANEIFQFFLNFAYLHFCVTFNKISQELNPGEPRIHFSLFMDDFVVACPLRLKQKVKREIFTFFN